jgi:hypothetical protein
VAAIIEASPADNMSCSRMVIDYAAIASAQQDCPQTQLTILNAYLQIKSFQVEGLELL